jgi:hypothetical protein
VRFGLFDAAMRLSLQQPLTLNAPRIKDVGILGA